MALSSWTDEQILDQLNSGYRWTNSTITYAFPQSWDGVYWDTEDGSSLALTASQQSKAVLALSLWDDLISPSFVKIDTPVYWYESDIEFGNATIGIGYARAISRTLALSGSTAHTTPNTAPTTW